MLLYFSIYLLWPMLVFKVKMQNVSFINILYQYTTTWNIGSVWNKRLSFLPLKMTNNHSKLLVDYVCFIRAFGLWRKFIRVRVRRNILFVGCNTNAVDTKGPSWDKKRWRRRGRKETWVLCSAGESRNEKYLHRRNGNVFVKHLVNIW